MADKKIGCYICTGCGIGDALDIAALEVVAKKEQKIPVVKNHAMLCGAEGLALIQKDMTGEGVNALVIAACSPREQGEAFRFDTRIMDRVSLRELVVWVHEQADQKDADTFEEDRNMAAGDYLTMGCMRVKKMNAPEPFQDPGFSKDILVVGGGVSGLTAAREIAKAGYKAILVEKSDALGGHVAGMHQVSASKPPYRDPQPNPIGQLIAEVEGFKSIEVIRNGDIINTAGAPGLFDVTIKTPSGDENRRVGALVVATGFKPYDPAKLGHLGHGSSPDVITGLEFEAMAKAGKIVRKSDGQPAKRVAFALCAGQRDAAHLEYCSSACCIASMKQARYVQDAYADGSAYVIFQEIRTPGQMEDFYRGAQDAGTVFIKGDIQKVATGSGGLDLEVKDKLLRSTETLQVDLLVLATGMEPNLDTQDPNVPAPVKPGPETSHTTLNLQYRQGPSLPNLKYGFADSHFICFPYETRRTGIYVAGPARRPMGIAAAMTDASGAALKAIQAVESVARGAAVHPRAGDLSYPSFRVEACTQCKRCTEECPFGAINEDDKGNPLFNPTRCRRCGTCMGACPQKIISFANYSVDMIGSMVKEVTMPEEDDEKPRVLVFCCENDAYPALDMAARNRTPLSTYVRVIPLRCMGSMSLVWIADAMSSGWDGVLLMGCRHGDDYQCHNVRGSALAEIRLSKVSETLKTLQLESARVRMIEVNIMDANVVVDKINQFVEDLSELGPNPFKEF
ncbi:MAG: hydrogenase iron-sulfur subunit [Magnetococcales bacterium]|nr:hydrogenase iron-sulfur subunit [Magnetococcales bacterium]